METNDSDPSIGGASTYNAREQLASMRGISPETFLGSGQTLRSVHGVSSYDYNALGLSEVDDNGTVFYFTREADGGLVNEYDASGRYFSYAFDGLGSITALTDSTGTAVNSYKYDAVGNKTTNTENVYNIWQYAGGLWSTSTGTVKFGERYYDPKIGRWTQPEPVDRQGIRFGNGYLYAGADPANYTDQTGLTYPLYLGGSSCSTSSCPAASAPSHQSGHIPDGPPSSPYEASYADCSPELPEPDLPPFFRIDPWLPAPGWDPSPSFGGAA